MVKSGLKLPESPITVLVAIALLFVSIVCMKMMNFGNREWSGYSQTSWYVPGATSGTWTSILPSRMSKPEARGSEERVD